MLRVSLSALLIIILSVPSIGQAATPEIIRIPLQIKSDSLLFGGTYLNLSKSKESNADLSKFIIPKNISDITVHYVELNGHQTVYARMANNQLNDKDSINYDLSDLQKFATSHSKPLQSKTYFISVSQGDSILLITDTNNNLDFTDEVIDVFRYDAMPQMLGNEYITKMPKKRLQYEYYLKDSNEIIQREFEIRLFFTANRYKEASYSSRPKLDLVLKSEEGRVGNFSVGEEEYVVLVQPSDASFDKYKSINLKVFNAKDSMPQMSNVNKKRLQEEDFISFGNELYQILSPTVFGTELVLKKVRPNEVIYGDKPKQYIRDFKAKTIDQEIYKLSDQRGKYVLLDFWGMWCHPCVEALPELKKIREAYKDLEVASVALLGRNETIEDLRTFVKNQNLDWTHIANESRSEESSIVKLRIRAYPTYILIDPDGKIIFRSLNSNKGTTRLNEILQSIYVNAK